MFNFVLGFAMIKLRVFAHAWDATAGLMDKVGLDQSRVVSHPSSRLNVGQSLTEQITHSLLWITATALISAIPGLFWSYYYTFVIEERHGFNKTTRKLWIMDNIKAYILTAVIGLPFLAGFLKIIELAGKNFVPWLMLFM